VGTVRYVQQRRLQVRHVVSDGSGFRAHQSSAYCTALNPDAFSKFFVEFYEHNTTVDDTDVKRRWHQRVLSDGMLKAVRDLCRRNKDNGEQIAVTLKDMPNSVWFGRTEKLLRAVPQSAV
jgi:hypothetical protein